VLRLLLTACAIALFVLTLTEWHHQRHASFMTECMHFYGAKRFCEYKWEYKGR
jgi:hypothetical protein